MLTLIDMKELRHYFQNCCYTDVLIPYVTSKNFSIGKISKISLAILYRQLHSTQAMNCLKLTQEDIFIILKVLSNQAISEEERRQCWNSLSKDGLILALKGFCSLKENSAEFVRQGGLNVLNCILDGDEDSDKEATLLLLWQLSHYLGAEMVENVEIGKELVDKICNLSVVAKGDEEENENDLLSLKISLPYCLLRSLPQGKAMNS